MGQTLHAHLNGYDKESDVSQSASLHGHCSVTFFNIAETTSGVLSPPYFFLHRSIQSHSTISRSIVYCRKAAIQASPSGPFEIMHVLSPISTSHLFTIYDPFVVPKLFCVHVTLCCATFVWLIHFRYTPLKVIFSLFNAVTRAGRRDCQPPRRTKCYTVQCSVQWSRGPRRDAVRSSQSQVMFLALLHMCTFFGSL